MSTPEELKKPKWDNIPLSPESSKMVTGAMALDQAAAKDTEINNRSYIDAGIKTADDNAINNEPIADYGEPPVLNIPISAYEMDMGVPSYDNLSTERNEMYDFEQTPYFDESVQFNQSFELESNQSFETEPNQAFETEPNQAFETESNQSFETEPVYVQPEQHKNDSVHVATDNVSTLKDNPDLQVLLYISAVTSMERQYENPKMKINELIFQKLGLSSDSSNDEIIASEYKSIMDTVRSEVSNLTMQFYRNADNESKLSPSVQEQLKQNFDNQNIKKMAAQELHKEYNRSFANDTLPKNNYGQPVTFQSLKNTIKESFQPLSSDFKGIAQNLSSPFNRLVEKDLNKALRTGNTSKILSGANYNVDYKNALSDVINNQFHLKDTAGNKAFFGEVPAGVTKDQYVQLAVDYLNAHNKNNVPTLNTQFVNFNGKETLKISGQPQKELDPKGFTQTVTDIRIRLGGTVDDTKDVSNTLKGKKDQNDEPTLEDKFNNNSEENEEEHQRKERERNKQNHNHYDDNGLSKAVSMLLNTGAALTVGVVKGIGLGAQALFPNAYKKTATIAKTAHEKTGNAINNAENAIKETMTKDGAKAATKAVFDNSKNIFNLVKDSVSPNQASSFVGPPKSIIIDLQQKYGDLGLELSSADMSANSDYQSKIDTLYSGENIDKIQSLNAVSSDNAVNIVRDIKSAHNEIFDEQGQNNSIISTDNIIANRKQLDLLYDSMLNPLRQKMIEAQNKEIQASFGEESQYNDSKQYQKLIEEVNEMRNDEYKHYVSRASNVVEHTIANSTYASAKLYTAAQNYQEFGSNEPDDPYRKKLIDTFNDYQAESDKKVKLFNNASNSLVEQSGIKDRDALLNFGRNISQLMTYEDENINMVKGLPKIEELIEQEPTLKNALDNDPKQVEIQKKASEEMLKAVQELMAKLSEKFGSVLSNTINKVRM